jgi:hypothetical protein
MIKYGIQYSFLNCEVNTSRDIMLKNGYLSTNMQKL